MRSGLSNFLPRLLSRRDLIGVAEEVEEADA